MKAPADGETHAISVVVRVRPPLQQEVRHGFCTRVEGGRRIVLDASPPAGGLSGLPSEVTAETRRSKTVECEYDKVLDITNSQEDVWRAVCPKVEKVLEGYNATIFTYGMTGSGKTFTMLGPRLMSVGMEECNAPTFQEVRECQQRGLVPRAIELLVGRQGSDSNSRLTMSYMQVYNEKCYDLLQPASACEPLKIREDSRSSSSRASACGPASSSVYVENLTESRVRSVEECLKKLLYGSSNIAFRSTAYNEQSSRAHVILTLTLTQTLSSKDGVVRRSKLHLVDLAGNERWDSFGQAMSPGHARELTSINQSLHALGSCIQALSKPPQVSKRNGEAIQTHVPYRNSVLTMLLRDSLGGSSFTLMLCTICNCSLYQMQSLGTLRFADRAKRLKMQARVNEVVDSKMLLQQSQAEVEYLRSLVAEGGMSLQQQQLLDELEGENRHLKEQVKGLTAEQCRIRESMAAEAGLKADAMEAFAHTRSAAAMVEHLRRTNSEPAIPPVSSWFSDLDSTVESTLLGTSALASTTGPLLLRGRDFQFGGPVPGPSREAHKSYMALQSMPSPRRKLSLSQQLAKKLEPEKQGHGSSVGVLMNSLPVLPHAELSSNEGVEMEGVTASSRASLSRVNRRCEPEQPKTTFVCPQGHALTCLGSSRCPLGTACYSEWHCDASNCGNGSSMLELGRYHCAQCQHDLCERCAGNQKKVQAAVAIAGGDVAAPSRDVVDLVGVVPSCQAKAAVAAADKAAAAALAKVPQPPRAQPPARARPAPRGQNHTQRGRGTSVPRQPASRAGSPTAAPSLSGSFSARGPSTGVRDRQSMPERSRGTSMPRQPASRAGSPIAAPSLSGSFSARGPSTEVRDRQSMPERARGTSMPRQPPSRAESPTVAVNSSTSLYARIPTPTDEERQLIQMEYYRQKFAEPSQVTAYGYSLDERPLGQDSESCKDMAASIESGNDENCKQEIYLPQDCIKLPVLGTVPVPTTYLEPIKPQPGHLQLEAAETQRRPWRKQHVADEAAQTRHQFFQSGSPRAGKAVPPSMCGSSPSQSPKAVNATKAVTRNHFPMPRSATGAPLSPLGKVTRPLQPCGAVDNPSARSIAVPSAAKDIAALHSRLGIHGLLRSPGPPAAAIDAGKPPMPAASAPESKPMATRQLAVAAGKGKLPAVFGAPSIGALLGELDSRHEKEPCNQESQTVMGRTTPETLDDPSIATLMC